MSVKKILKSNKYTFYLIKKLLIIRYLLLFNFNKMLRLTGLSKHSRFEKLKEIKNKHKGERVFIIATGPSLKLGDLEKLKNEVTFSMNSICLAFEETDWRPTYYAIQDLGVYRKFEQEIANLECKGKFVSNGIAKQKEIPNDYFVYPLNLLNHSFSHRKYNTKFSDDAFSVVYDGYNITYSIIQLAVYMGFKEIYLLGTDCDYSSSMNHHFKEYGIVDPSFLSAGERMTCAYQEARKYADRHPIQIYNATRGGKLEVFERVNLDELLSEDYKTERAI